MTAEQIVVLIGVLFSVGGSGGAIVSFVIGELKTKSDVRRRALQRQEDKQQIEESRVERQVQAKEEVRLQIGDLVDSYGLEAIRGLREEAQQAELRQKELLDRINDLEKQDADKGQRLSELDVLDTSKAARIKALEDAEQEGIRQIGELQLQITVLQQQVGTLKKENMDAVTESQRLIVALAEARQLIIERNTTIEADGKTRTAAETEWAKIKEERDSLEAERDALKVEIEELKKLTLSSRVDDSQ